MKKVSSLLILSVLVFCISIFSDFQIRNQLLYISSIISIILVLNEIKSLLNLDIENDTSFVKGKLLLNFWIIYFMFSFILSNSFSALSPYSSHDFELNFDFWFYFVSIFCLACIVYLMKDSNFGKKINNFTGWFFYCLALVAFFVSLFYASALTMSDFVFFYNAYILLVIGTFLSIIISLILFIIGLKKNKTPSDWRGLMLNIILLLLLIGSSVYFVIFSNKTSDANNLSQENETKNTDKLTFHSYYGYSIEYPALWVLYRFPIPAKGYEDNPVIHLENADSDKRFYEIIYLMNKKTDFCDVDDSGSNCKPGSFGTSFKLEVEENSNNSTLEEIVNKETKPFINDLRMENGTIGGQRAIKYWLDCVSNGGIGCDVMYWKIIYDKYIYTIYYGFANINTDKELDEIVQSIQFGSEDSF